MQKREVPFFLIRPIKEEEFDEVYALMEQSFPTEEYRGRDRQLQLTRQKCYRLWCYRQGERIVGFAAVWSLEDFWFVEHLAVAPSLRGQGIGGQLLDALLEMSPGKLCLEVELPNTPIARRRIDFYRRHGFYLNSYAYRQPSISAGKPSLPLLIMSYPCAMTREEFLKTKDVLYCLVYGKQ